MSAVTNSITLQILWGIPPAPSDTNSADSIKDSLDLLDATGLGLLTEGWSPQIAPLKNGGLWIESAIMDGRSLLSANVGNVIETMQVTCSSPMVENRLAILKKLGRIANMARAFHSSTWQIDPVYLKWVAACGVEKPQYALIYNIDWSINGDTFDPLMAWDVTLTIERESYWRGLWPGANPIEWTFQAQGKTPGITSPNNGYTYANMGLHENADHLGYRVLKNYHEWGGSYSVRNIQNFLTIPAASIPGDAPALVCVTIEPDQSGAENNMDALYIAKRTAPLTKNDQTGDLRAMAFTLNAADATTVSNFTLTTDASFGLRALTTSTKQVQAFSIGTGASGSIRWTDATTLANYPLQLMRGNWLVGIRVWQNHGADGDVVATLNVKEASDTTHFTEFTTNEVPVPDTTVNDMFLFVPLGVIKLPLGANSVSAVNGRGLFISDSTDNDLHFLLTLRNTTGTTVTGEVQDLVFIPIDEGCVSLINPVNTTGTPMIYDSTGYFSHGVVGSFGYSYDQDIEYHVFTAEMRGSSIELTPGVDNHILILLAAHDSGTVLPTLSITARLNIIPRWSSVRDA